MQCQLEAEEFYKELAETEKHLGLLTKALTAHIELPKEIEELEMAISDLRLKCCYVALKKMVPSKIRTTFLIY